MFGDPHLVTLDGYQYTFNGKGEFTLVETLDRSFVLQGRMIQPTDSSSSNSTSAADVRGTSFSALAVRQDSSPTVQLEVDTEDDRLLVLVAGEELDFAGMMEQRVGNVTVARQGNDTMSIVVRFVSGASVQASKLNHILTDILVTIPEHFSTRGLLGQLNGDPEDDLLPQNTDVPLLLNSTLEQIHSEFGLTCEPKNS